MRVQPLMFVLSLLHITILRTIKSFKFLCLYKNQDKVSAIQNKHIPLLFQFQNTILSTMNIMAQVMANFCITMSNQYLKLIEQELDGSLKAPVVQNTVKVKEEDGSSSVLSSEKHEEKKIKVKKPRVQIDDSEKPEKPEFLSERPKAPASSYLIFLHENKAQIAAKHKATSVADVARASSTEWKLLPPQQRQKYNDIANLQKKRYYSELQVYNRKYAPQLNEYSKKKQAFYRRKMKMKKKEEELHKVSKDDQEKKQLIETLKEIDSSILSSEPIQETIIPEKVQ